MGERLTGGVKRLLFKEKKSASRYFTKETREALEARGFQTFTTEAPNPLEVAIDLTCPVIEGSQNQPVKKHPQIAQKFTSDLKIRGVRSGLLDMAAISQLNEWYRQETGRSLLEGLVVSARQEGRLVIIRRVQIDNNNALELSSCDPRSSFPDTFVLRVLLPA